MLHNQKIDVIHDEVLKIPLKAIAARDQRLFIVFIATAGNPGVVTWFFFLLTNVCAACVSLSLAREPESCDLLSTVLHHTQENNCCGAQPAEPEEAQAQLSAVLWRTQPLHSGNPGLYHSRHLWSSYEAFLGVNWSHKTPGSICTTHLHLAKTPGALGITLKLS